MAASRRMAGVPILVSLALGLAASGPARAQQPTPSAAGDWTAVERALGRPGQPQPDGTIRFGFPRSDLRVTVQGVPVRPALALGSWVAFRRIGADAEAMGDLVLTQEEVVPLTDALEAAGIEETAVHNHLLNETPRVMYVHIRGHGEATHVAEGIRAALGRTATPMQPAAAAPAAPLDLDTAAVAAALGHHGKVNGGVYQVSVPRAEPIREGGMEVPPSMGVATALNFQPTGGGKAAVTGDFVLLSKEVNPVIRALREGGIAVTALHSHMLDEEPRLYFMHFWANDDAVKLARWLRAALDRTSSKPARSSP